MHARRGRFVAASLTLTLIAGLSFAHVPPATAAPTHDSPKWALLVGINAYRPPVARTAGSVGDVVDLRDVLIDSGWPAGNIRTLTDDQATGAAIREGWRWLASKSSDDSFSIFHYSGHTKQMAGDRDRDGEELDEYLWPVDNNFLSDSELGSAMRSIKGWLWTDMSGCEAAGFNDGIAAPTRLFTAASREHEKAYDSADWENSIFTGLLADRGYTRGRGDANEDGVITIHEAFDYAASVAPELTKRQSAGPQHPYIAGGGGREWYFNAPAPPPPDDRRSPSPVPGWPFPWWPFP